MGCVMDDPLDDPLNGGSSPDGNSDFLISGLSLILVTSYAPFTIAALLATRLPSVPLGFFVAAVFLSMAIGTLLSAGLTRTGLIVAPAVGMASFVNQTSQDTISTGEFLLAALIAGFVAILLSRPRRSKDDKKLLPPSDRPFSMGFLFR